MPLNPFCPALDQPALLHRRFDETREQRMRIERLRLEFRMELHPDKPWMVRALNDFRQHAVGRHARKDEPALFELFAIRAVDLITMAVALADVVGAIDPRDRSEEHTSELQSLMRIQYSVFCWKKKNIQ